MEKYAWSIPACVIRQSRPRKIAATVDVRHDLATVHEGDTISTRIAHLRH